MSALRGDRHLDDVYVFCQPHRVIPLEVSGTGAGQRQRRSRNWVRRHASPKVRRFSFNCWEVARASGRGTTPLGRHPHRQGLSVRMGIVGTATRCAATACWALWMTWRWGPWRESGRSHQEELFDASARLDREGLWWRPSWPELREGKRSFENTTGELGESTPRLRTHKKSLFGRPCAVELFSFSVLCQYLLTLLCRAKFMVALTRVCPSLPFHPAPCTRGYLSWLTTDDSPKKLVSVCTVTCASGSLSWRSTCTVSLSPFRQSSPSRVEPSALFQPSSLCFTAHRGEKTILHCPSLSQPAWSLYLLFCLEPHTPTTTTTAFHTNHQHQRHHHPLIHPTFRRIRWVRGFAKISNCNGRFIEKIDIVLERAN